MKETAIEWLIDQIQQKLYIRDNVIEQAKEMEKQQIIDAYWEGCSNFDNDTEAEQYYNETFNK
jgi:hypothetical protein